MKKYNNLITDLYNENEEMPLSNHPNPQFMRDSYYSLNGIWKYKISKNPTDLNNINSNILVPFPIESFASKVNKRLSKGEYIIYKKRFTLPTNFIKDKTFINFLGVDQKFTLILNGHTFTETESLCLPKIFDISNYIASFY